MNGLLGVVNEPDYLKKDSVRLIMEEMNKKRSLAKPLKSMNTTFKNTTLFI